MVPFTGVNSAGSADWVPESLVLMSATRYGAAVGVVRSSSESMASRRRGRGARRGDVSRRIQDGRVMSIEG